MMAGALFRRLNRHAGKFFVVGLLVLLGRTWRHWQRDRQALAQLPDPKPVPLWQEWQSCPNVSILVAAWNEATHLPDLLASFHQITYPNLELVLRAGGKDGTFELAKRWESDSVRVLEQRSGEGKFGSLARCFTASGGEIIMLTDADCILSDTAFEALIHPIALGTEQATTGRFQPRTSQIVQPFVRRQWAQQRYYQVVGESVYSQFLAGVNSAFRGELLANVWDADDVGVADDFYLAMSVQESGARIRFVPNSEVETDFPDHFNAYVRQQSRWHRAHLSQAQRFAKPDLIRHIYTTLAMNTAMLLMPLALVLGRIGFVTWILAWLSFALAHLRFARVLNTVEPLPEARAGSGLAQIVISNFAAAAIALVEHTLPGRRQRW